MDTKNFKVAFVTDDGKTISCHFGRAKYYEVIIIENGEIKQRERRDNPVHHISHDKDAHNEHHGHGWNRPSHEKHQMMSKNISDCQIVVTRGMGNGAYQHLLESNIQPIITNTATIEEAVVEIINGTIKNYTNKLH